MDAEERERLAVAVEALTRGEYALHDGAIAEAADVIRSWPIDDETVSPGARRWPSPPWQQLPDPDRT